MKKLGISAALLGMLAVVTGAFGAHALSGKLPENLLTAWNTAVEYQFYHALALLATAILYHFFPHRFIRFAAYSFVAGTVLFSGSIYLMGISHLAQFGALWWLGPITPVGGLLLISGWLFLIAFFAKPGYEKRAYA